MIAKGTVLGERPTIPTPHGLQGSRGLWTSPLQSLLQLSAEAWMLELTLYGLDKKNPKLRETRPEQKLFPKCVVGRRIGPGRNIRGVETGRDSSWYAAHLFNYDTTLRVNMAITIIKSKSGFRASRRIHRITVVSNPGHWPKPYRSLHIQVTAIQNPNA